jgi:hypothetical protein
MGHARNFVSADFLLVLSVDLAYHHRSITLSSEAVKFKAQKPIAQHPTSKSFLMNG